MTRHANLSTQRTARKAVLGGGTPMIELRCQMIIADRVLSIKNAVQDVRLLLPEMFAGNGAIPVGAAAAFLASRVVIQ